MVTVTEAERDEVKDLVAKGSKLARKVKKAQVLLAADSGASERLPSGCESEMPARLAYAGSSMSIRRAGSSPGPIRNPLDSISGRQHERRIGQVLCEPVLGAQRFGNAAGDGKQDCGWTSLAAI